MRSSSDRKLGHLESSGLCSRSAEDEKGSVKDMLARPVSRQAVFLRTCSFGRPI